MRRKSSKLNPSKAKGSLLMAKTKKQKKKKTKEKEKTKVLIWFSKSC